jgi:hypothetical protein
LFGLWVLKTKLVPCSTPDPFRDVGSFGSIQTLPAWLAAFGEDIDGVRTLSTSRRAAMNSCKIPRTGFVRVEN